jgi:hypothetical protein
MKTEEESQGITAIEKKKVTQGILASRSRKAKIHRKITCRTTPRTFQRSGKTTDEGDSAKSLNQICDNRHDTDRLG